jgi:hypothetical protein
VSFVRRVDAPCGREAKMKNDTETTTVRGRGRKGRRWKKCIRLVKKFFEWFLLILCLNAIGWCFASRL